MQKEWTNSSVTLDPPQVNKFKILCLVQTSKENKNKNVIVNADSAVLRCTDWHGVTSKNIYERLTECK